MTVLAHCGDSAINTAANFTSQPLLRMVKWSLWETDDDHDKDLQDVCRELGQGLVRNLSAWQCATILDILELYQ